MLFENEKKINKKKFFSVNFLLELDLDHVLLPVGVDPEVVAVDGGVEVGVLQPLSCTF